MSERRGGLGRGLGALIPTTSEDSGTDGIYREVPIDRIHPNPYQPRSRFDEESLQALAASVRAVGVIQPLVVREVGEGYELIAGERRWRAARRAGLTAVPVLVRRADDQSSLETAVVENLHRQDLNPLEEAAAYQQLLDEFGLSQQEVAQRVGRSRSAVANTIRLLQLPPPVQAHLVDGRLSAGHGRALLGLPDPDDQVALAEQIVEEGLTVRQTEERVRAATRVDGEETSADVAETPPPATPVADDVDPGVLELEELLAARLDTRVTVRWGRGPGRIVIEFADLDDLERIYHIITPPGTVV
ncbi:MAG: ParB/RepB/Spo0J family partition protein [Actinomyces sp.]|nr:MAG: ParB/RepB/Spo0J family partition protein [Actinomyces sp.]